MCVYRLFYNGVFSIQIVVAFIVDDDSYGAFTMHVHLNLSLSICAAEKQTKKWVLTEFNRKMISFN